MKRYGSLISMNKLLVPIILTAVLSASLIAWIFISKNPSLGSSRIKYSIDDALPTPNHGTQGTPIPLNATPLPTAVPPEKPIDPSTLLKSESDEITIPDIDMADLQTNLDDLQTN